MAGLHTSITLKNTQINELLIIPSAPRSKTHEKKNRRGGGGERKEKKGVGNRQIKKLNRFAAWGEGKINKLTMEDDYLVGEG